MKFEDQAEQLFYNELAALSVLDVGPLPPACHYYIGHTGDCWRLTVWRREGSAWIVALISEVDWRLLPNEFFRAALTVRGLQLLETPWPDLVAMDVEGGENEAC